MVIVRDVLVSATQTSFRLNFSGPMIPAWSNARGRRVHSEIWLHGKRSIRLSCAGDPQPPS